MLSRPHLLYDRLQIFHSNVKPSAAQCKLNLSPRNLYSFITNALTVSFDNQNDWHDEGDSHEYEEYHGCNAEETRFVGASEVICE